MSMTEAAGVSPSYRVKSTLTANTSLLRTGRAGSAIDQMVAKTYQPRASYNVRPDPAALQAITTLRDTNKSLAQSALTANTQNRRQYQEDLRRGDEAQAEANRNNAKVVGLLDKINDAIQRSSRRNGGGLIDSALDLIGLGGARGLGKYRDAKGRFKARPKSFMGRLGSRLGLGGGAVAETATAGATKIGRSGGGRSLFRRAGLKVLGKSGVRALELGGRVAGKVALPIAAAMAVADGVQGVRHADELLGRKASNGDKIGIAVTEAVNGALLGLPDFISKKVFGVGFSKGLNTSAKQLSGAFETLFPKSMARAVTVVSKVGDSIGGWFTKLESSVSAVVTSIKNGEWGKVPGQIGKVLALTPAGLAVTAAAKAAPGAVRAVKSASATVVAEAKPIVAGAGRALVSGAKAVAAWAGIGSTSKHYESGSGGAGTVSSGKGDPGGASYGTYQLASKTGTLDKYLKSSGYASQFKGMKAGSKEFNAKWKELAKSDPKFGDSQHEFIKRTHYDPAAKYAQSLGFDTNDRGIADAIWSASVQHGGVKKILAAAAATPGWDKLDNKGKIKRLYEARTEYANKHGVAADAGSARYAREVNDALALSGTTGDVKQVSQPGIATNVTAQAAMPVATKATTEAKPKAVVTEPKASAVAVVQQATATPVATEYTKPPPPLPKPAPPAPAPTPTPVSTNTQAAAPKAAAPPASQGGSPGKMPPIDSVPTYPSLEQLAIVSTAFR